MSTLYKVANLSVRRIFFSIFLFIFTLIVMTINLEKSSGKKLRRVKVNISKLFLENIIDSEMDIEKDRNIFFVDTTRMKNPHKTRELTIRQACSIESAALSNLGSKVFIILVSPSQTLREISFTPLMQALLDYPNVYVKSMNLVQFSIDTPYEHFVANKNGLLSSRFIKQHTSDFIRLLLLIKYGGVYIDTDIIVMDNVQKLPKNFICRDHGYLNGAILKLSNKKGRNFGKLFMNDMIKNFNGSEWGWNGPIMLYRVLKDICKTDDVNELDGCNGFDVLDQNICYPISGLQWEKFFDESIADDVMNLVSRSHVVHFWNKLSQNSKLACNSTAAYTRLARKYCPNIFKLCQHYF